MLMNWYKIVQNKGVNRIAKMKLKMNSTIRKESRELAMKFPTKDNEVVKPDFLGSKSGLFLLKSKTLD